MGKLRALKDHMKKWNVEIFGDTRNRRKQILDDIDELNRIMEGRGQDPNLERTKVDLLQELEVLSLKENRSMRQKMKPKWAKEGDTNSKLFFKVVNGRRNKNFIKEIECEDGRVLRREDSIVEKITGFLKNLCSEERMDRPMLVRQGLAREAF